MQKTGVRAAICAVMSFGQAAAAQAVPATAPVPCELHVWPAAGLGSVYHGWVGGGINNGAVDGRPGYPKVPAGPLDPEVQQRLLTDAQPQVLLRRVDDKLVIHADALPSRTARTTPGRIEPASAPCYAELIVDTVTVRQDIITGSQLLTLFRYRDFGSGTVPQWTFGTWVKTPLGRLDGASDGGISEIRAAYKANLGLFAQALNVAGGSPPR